MSFFMDDMGYVDMDECEMEMEMDDYLRERFERWMRCETYGDLNDEMSVYMWDLTYPSHIVRDLIKNGIYESVDELKWINDIITRYVNKSLYECYGWSDDDE